MTSEAIIAEAVHRLELTKKKNWETGWREPFTEQEEESMIQFFVNKIKEEVRLGTFQESLF